MEINEKVSENPITKEVSIILPTYNESMNIKPLIEKISHTLRNHNHEIIVVDDNSPDKTWEITENLNNENVTVIKRTENRGLVNSLREGINQSKGKFIVWMDADQSMPPEIIPRLIEELKINNIAVASRYVKGGKDLRPKLRLITSRMINLAANLILNFKVLDYTSGYIAARSEVLNNLPLPSSVYGEYCIAFLYQATRQNYRIKEVPYSFIDRLKGESKTASDIMSLLNFGWVYFKRIIHLRLGGK